MNCNLLIIIMAQLYRSIVMHLVYCVGNGNLRAARHVYDVRFWGKCSTWLFFPEMYH